MAMWDQMCGLSMTCLWLGIDLDLEYVGAILCPGGGMFV